MTHHRNEAERALAETTNRAFITPDEFVTFTGAAQVHASLAILDQLGEITELLRAWRADVNSEPIPGGEA